MDMASLLPQPINERRQTLLASYSPDRYSDKTRRMQLA
jgi:hypothetical protein